MIRVHQELLDRRLATRMILQVHDELLFEGPEAERVEISSVVMRAMETAYELAVPLQVDVGWGRNWNEAHG